MPPVTYLYICVWVCVYSCSFFNVLLSCWHQITPNDPPTRFSTVAICLEVNVDDVTVAGDPAWQGGAAGLLHQSCPVLISDLQVVEATRGVELNVEGSEL